MKIIVVGASGTIGQAVCAALSGRHELVNVGFSSGDYQVDIADEQSIIQLFEQIGAFDALISTTGKVHFGELSQFNREKWSIGLDNKLMGQVNLVMHGLKYINDGGSFTLTSGILNQDPIRFGSSAAMVNGALEGFIASAAIELPKQARINIVSPTVVKESLPVYQPYFWGFPTVVAAEVAQAYVKSIEGLQTGQIIRAGW